MPHSRFLSVLGEGDCHMRANRRKGHKNDAILQPQQLSENKKFPFSSPLWLVRLCSHTEAFPCRPSLQDSTELLGFPPSLTPHSPFLSVLEWTIVTCVRIGTPDSFFTEDILLTCVRKKEKEMWKQIKQLK
ncbi:hypothetical protein CDAR_231671 [Caerostris darwini]|uniref:Uncharacterized protein n=1 Tax=Caerostris darwini TaxID=1538125 RepID=A0AAV4X5I5_9ARAC|nr:hypothetical protein CDAR_231541 [Caerostris darwini]GIY90101.1 hypothetical protein CDAR_231671 [Caerostris darwini]